MLVMTAASRFGLVFVWTVFLFKHSEMYSLLTGLVIIVLDFDKRTFSSLPLVSWLGINSVTSPDLHCDLGNLST